MHREEGDLFRAVATFDESFYLFSCPYNLLLRVFVGDVFDRVVREVVTHIESNAELALNVAGNLAQATVVLLRVPVYETRQPNRRALVEVP